MKKIIIACAGDWHANVFSRSLYSLNYEILRISNSKLASNSNFSECIYLRSASHLLFLQKIIRKKMYQNFATYNIFKEFDIKTSECVKKYKPDMVFVWTGMAVETLKVCSLMNIPSILVQGNSPLKYLNEVMGGDFFANEDWVNNQNLEYNLCSGILVESNYVKNNLIKVGVEKDKIHILAPHVTVPKFFVLGASGNNFATIQVGKRKGTHRLINWFDDENNSTCVLNIFGSNNEKIIARGKNIKFHGHLNGSSFQNELIKSSISLFPTYEDGGPRALFESMAFGLCPIVSEKSAGPDHIINGNNGFLLNVDNDSDWLKAIKWCSENGEEARNIGLRAREYIKNNLDISFLPHKLNSIVKSLI